MNHQPTRRKLIVRTINTALDCLGAAVILGGGLFLYCFGEELLNILADYLGK
tara:strand:- start:85 stop:240 length:156 start_codon:yes stop_codon:yes gene_type:complete